MDIDSDFEDSGRQAVIEYCRQKYGADHVAAIVTFGTSKAKDAVKAASRSLYDDYKIGDEICQFIPDTPGTKLKDCLDIPEIAQMIAKDKRKAKIVDIALKWENLKTSQSSHPCGVLITDKPIVEYMPEVKLLNKKTDELEWVSSAEGPMCEELGCLKMDFLGISTLGYMHEAIKMIEENTGNRIDYNSIPLDDVDVYEFLAEGNTASVFQLESSMFTSLVDKAYKDLKGRIEATRNIKNEVVKQETLKKLGEEMFNRLVDMNALVRPGPNAYINDYCRNIMNPSLIKFDHPSMEDQLRTTYGFMIYQEQVMTLVRIMAGFSAGQSDLIRKSMG